MEPVVEAENLLKIYPGGIEAVRGISFSVERGEAFGLLGPNGAGKSTTIGMLNSTVTPTSGRARLGGVDVQRDPLRTRRMSSVVFQDAVVDRPLTGRQNLLLHTKLWGVQPGEGRAKISELSQAVGIDDILDRPVATYSGGQRRRMEIVRALLSAPEVLFLDEPTVGLDTRIRHDLFDAIGALRDRTGVTIIMTTHYLDEAERLCDRLAIIDHGRIVASDSPAALLETLGEEMLEVRVDSPDRALRVLLDSGIPADDVMIIGGTVTVSVRKLGASRVQQFIADQGISARSATTRHPTLDDVYLRLTGDRIADQAA